MGIAVTSQTGIAEFVIALLFAIYAVA